jgi:hypothetical protein
MMVLAIDPRSCGGCDGGWYASGSNGTLLEERIGTLDDVFKDR